MFKILIVIVVLGVGGWFGYQNYGSMLGAEFGGDPNAGKNYVANIIKVNASQVEYLITSGSRNQRPTLLFIFESGCLMCKWHYSDITHFAKQYTRNQLNVIILSLDSDEMVLADFLAKDPPTVRPLFLKQGERENLFSVLRKLGSDYDGGVPHISVINKAGHFDDIGIGWDRKNKINGFILRSLDVKA